MTSGDKMEFSDYVREAINHVGGQQTELAKRMSKYTSTKITQKHVNNWLNRNTTMTIESAYAIEKVSDGKVMAFDLIPELKLCVDEMITELKERQKYWANKITPVNEDKGATVRRMTEKYITNAQRMIEDDGISAARDNLINVASIVLLAIKNIEEMLAGPSDKGAR